MAVAFAIILAAGVFLSYASVAFPEALRLPARAGAGAGLRERLAGTLQDAGLAGTPPATLLAVMAGAGFGGAVLALLFFGWPIVALAVGGLAAAAPLLYLRFRAARRRAQALEAVADAIDTLRNAIRAGGMGHEQAFRFLATASQEPVRSVFQESLQYLELQGFPQAVDHARRRLNDPVFHQVAFALVASYERGGSLATVLAELSRHVRAQITARREVRVLQARNVTSARILALMPVFILLAMRLIRPDYVAPYGSAGGQIVLAVCFVLVAAGYALMLRVAQIPEEGGLTWQEEQ